MNDKTSGDIDPTLEQTMSDEVLDAALADGADGRDPLQVELEEARERTLRVQAELENYRKRVRREMEEERRYAHLDLLRDLLPVLDNVGRAIEAAQQTSDAAGLLEGFKLVGQQLEGVLNRYDCQRITAQGEVFDPNLHQAISQQASSGQPPGTVLIVAQDGFQLHDRVVRPAQVVIAAPQN
jgi:molecular chaperone GrpE